MFPLSLTRHPPPNRITARPAWRGVQYRTVPAGGSPYAEPMTPERWQRVKAIVQEALAQPLAGRGARVAEACRGDAEIARDVDSLLRAHEQAGTFIETPALARPHVAALLDQFEATPTWTGRRVGPYVLERELGHGGMGAVYLAIRADDAYRKQVAIKVVQSTFDPAFIRQRFRHERQILADLDHPNIARLLDGGSTEDGAPYFVMEYVDGLPIDRYCDVDRLSIDARLVLFLQVCAAVHYAHQHLVVHRDLKASNVLVAADGTPKLLDFGIAKLLDADRQAPADRTATAMRTMTLESASPEQVRGDAVTTATDVYGLGVLLYRLLTGRGPHDTATSTPHDLAREICDTDARHPSDVATGPDVARRLRGDLDTIVLKALQKDPARRYGTVDEFVRDVTRHMGDLPVHARADTIGYRTTKFVRRHAIGVAASALIAVSLIAGIVATAWQAHVARVQRSRAEHRFNDVRRLAHTFMFDIHDAIQKLPGSTTTRRLLVTNALEYLDSLARDAGGDAGLQRELATAYEKMADVLGRPNTPNLGDLGGALTTYRKAQAARQGLLAADPGNRDIQRDLSTASLKLAYVLFYAGDLRAGVEEARQASVIEEGLTVADGTPAQALRLGTSYTLHGYLLGASGRTAESLERLKRALATLEPLQASGWNLHDVQLQLTLAYGYVAEVLSEGAPVAGLVPDLAAALEMYRRAQVIDERLAAENVLDTTLQRRTFVGHTHIGDVLSWSGDRTAALEQYRLALVQADRMSRADAANQQARSDFALASYRVGTLLAQQGETEEAFRLLYQSAKLLEALIAADSANLSTRSRVADCNVGLGYAHAMTAANPRLDRDTRLKHWREARARFQDGYAFWKEMRDRGSTTGVEAARPDELALEIAKCDLALRKLTVAHG